MRRIKRIRQMFHRSCEWMSMLNECLYGHIVRGTFGVCVEDAEPRLIVAHVVGHVPWGRVQNCEALAVGPLGLLLASLAGMGARMDGDWMFYFPGCPCVSIVREPWQ
eukprot:8982214-Alexandrium_andersonii.AAC.1